MDSEKSKPSRFANSQDEPAPAEETAVTAEAIERSITAFRIGDHLRSLRQRKRISLVDLGQLTGLSPSMLSQLENGKLIPTLPTLTRIALAFGVGLDTFFAGREQPRSFRIVRAGQRPRIPVTGPGDETAYVAEPLTPAPGTASPFEACAVEFPPRTEPSPVHSHPGVELIYVLAGQLEIRAGSAVHVLHPGDSACFDSSQPHAYRSHSAEPAQAVVVTTVQP